MDCDCFPINPPVIPPVKLRFCHAPGQTTPDSVDGFRVLPGNYQRQCINSFSQVIHTPPKPDFPGEAMRTNACKISGFIRSVTLAPPGGNHPGPVPARPRSGPSLPRRKAVPPERGRGLIRGRKVDNSYLYLRWHVDRNKGL